MASGVLLTDRWIRRRAKDEDGWDSTPHRLFYPVGGDTVCIQHVRVAGEKTVQREHGPHCRYARCPHRQLPLWIGKGNQLYPNSGGKTIATIAAHPA